MFLPFCPSSDLMYVYLSPTQRYDEAAQHILDALSLQDSDSVRDPGGQEANRGVTSSALWDSLKTCCLHMQRLDLATLCDQRDLEGAWTYSTLAASGMRANDQICTYSIPFELPNVVVL